MRRLPDGAQFCLVRDQRVTNGSAADSSGEGDTGPFQTRRRTTRTFASLPTLGMGPVLFDEMTGVVFGLVRRYVASGWLAAVDRQSDAQNGVAPRGEAAR
jgi:hypothetical protein